MRTLRIAILFFFVLIVSACSGQTTILIAGDSSKMYLAADSKTVINRETKYGGDSISSMCKIGSTGKSNFAVAEYPAIP